MLVVVCYDTPDNGRRRQFVRTLEGYGQRVQRSVWECDVSRREWERLRDALERVIDAEEDSVRCYHICAECVPRMEGLGHGDQTPTRTPAFWLV